jgi:TetR/AcrR family transcriptional regulator, copper-responsive repressor
MIGVKYFIVVAMKKVFSPAKPRGRPPAFDKAKALDAAMREFWANGYEGTSLADLQSAMGMNAPSIYNAFGDKKALFEQSVDAYQQGPGCFAQKALEEEMEPRAAIQRLLMEAAVNFTSKKYPSGCMVVLSALNCSDEDAGVRDGLSQRRRASSKAIAARISEAKLPNGISAELMTDIVVTLFQGLSIRARDGATRAQLEAVVAQSLRIWPEKA